MKLRQAFGLVSASLLISFPAFALPGSDFEFNRGTSNPTDFHNTTYSNGMTGQNADAFQVFVNNEASALDLETIQARKLNANQLIVGRTKDIEVYFIKEETQGRNKISITAKGSTQLTGLVFNDIVCLSSGCNRGTELTSPPSLDASKVLNPGDYVSLGNILGGSYLDFPIITSQSTFYADTALNRDGQQHVIAYAYEGYLVIGYEDAWGGGDRDYNDTVIAINIGQENLDCIPSYGEEVSLACSTAFLYAD